MQQLNSFWSDITPTKTDIEIAFNMVSMSYKPVMIYWIKNNQQKNVVITLSTVEKFNNDYEKFWNELIG